MDSQKDEILTHSAPGNEADRQARWSPWPLVSVGSIALLSMVTAFALVPAPDASNVKTELVLEQLATPAYAILETGSMPFLREERIQKSDTISSLMNRLEVADAEAISFIRKDAKAQIIFRQMRPGVVVSATTDELGQLLSLYFPLGKDSVLVIERTENGFKASEQTLALETQVVVKSGQIKYTLFGATDVAGIPDSIAIQLAEVFSGDIDFHKDLRKGDQFSLVYEMHSSQGRPVKSGRILSAEFVNNKKLYTAYWFETPDGKGGYYNANGGSLRKAFLRAPLEFSRVSSGFSSSRLHPVFKYNRAHKGIDYAAPTGTPIRAVADATVEFAGKQNGYGNLIVLKHHGVYSTAYAHMNGFASGLKKGMKVSQGDTIGYVGQTGVATGPHLHYEFRLSGKQVNPATIDLPEATPLATEQIALFKKAAAPLQEKLELAKHISVAGIE